MHLAWIIFWKTVMISDEYEMSWVKSISRRGKITKLWISRSAQVFVIKDGINCLQCSACVDRGSNPINNRKNNDNNNNNNSNDDNNNNNINKIIMIKCLQCSACVQRGSNPISHALAGSEGGDAVEGNFES